MAVTQSFATYLVKDKLVSLFENSPSGIAFIDHQGLIGEVNPQYCQLLGYDRPELLRRPLYAVVHPGDAPKVAKLILLLGERQPVRYVDEKRYLTKGGEVVWGQQNVSIQYDAQAGAWYAIEIVTDLTREKKVMNDLQTAQGELKERNFELDQFVYRTSHDLRSPLTTILGLINVIKLKPIPQEIQQYLAMAENRVLKLDHFLQLMLNYLRNTRLELANQIIDFDALLKACLLDLAYTKGSDSVSVQWHITPPVPFYSDPLRIQIIFQNLISNAIKYQDTTTGSPYLHIDILPRADACEIVFSDNGQGMQAGDLERITNMFFRASPQSDGSGLGMYIVKGAIDRLRGTIAIESPAGKGMNTRICIPNGLAEAPPSSHPS
jgi:PAS domain S-box-containing protein